jgi:predicted nucleic acid-binding Zn ribbon protein
MIVKLKCRVCGTEFRSERLNQLYCSDACRKQGRKEYFKSRYENNKEQLNEQSKIWRENHREYTKIKQREWNKKNPDYGTNRSRKIRGSKEYARECIVCGKAFTTWRPQKKTCSDACKEVHAKERDKERKRNQKRTRNAEKEHERWIRRRYGSEESYQKWLAEQEVMKQELNQKREQERRARREAYEKQLEEWRIERKARKEVNHRKDFCIVCGKEYETYNPAQKTCSKECGKRLKHAHKHKRIPKNQLVDKDITLEALYIRDSGVCYLCGGLCDWSDTRDGIVGSLYPSIDHVTPISRGGLHSWGNVRLAHFECNWKKSDTLLADAN